MRIHRLLVAGLLTVAASASARPQAFSQAPAATAPAAPASSWTSHAAVEYGVIADQPYLKAGGVELTLDLYVPNRLESANPTLIYFHGGGWVLGSKASNVMHLLPYLEMGWTVVNVQYRLASVSLAPAAVEDCRCALRWVIRHAEQYKIDVGRIVLSGHSAGGHLALITAMLPTAAGLDHQCLETFGPPTEASRVDPRVAAVVNWYGITDVAAVLSGPGEQGYANAWLGSLVDRVEIARRVSPLTYVRAGVPPVISIHGAADRAVPYAHATRLHEALGASGVRNELVTIPQGGHGGFTAAENARAFAAIRSFLAGLGLPAARR